MNKIELISKETFRVGVRRKTLINQNKISLCLSCLLKKHLLWIFCPRQSWLLWLLKGKLSRNRFLFWLKDCLKKVLRCSTRVEERGLCYRAVMRIEIHWIFFFDLSGSDVVVVVKGFVECMCHVYLLENWYFDFVGSQMDSILKKEIALSLKSWLKVCSGNFGNIRVRLVSMSCVLAWCIHWLSNRDIT